MGIAGLTAWHVVELGEVGPGDRVLVLGASGGVGLPTVSLVASTGAVVWGQTGQAAKAEAVRAMGAAEVVVTGADGLAAALRELAPTVVVDPLGDGFTAAALGAMAPDGRLVIFGTSAGAEAPLPLQQLYRSGLRVLGYAGLRLTTEQRRAGLSAALAALADGRLRIRIDRELALDGVDEAFRLLTDRAVTGKIVLALRGSKRVD
jgi:NADPH2:quinone reductase